MGIEEIEVLIRNQQLEDALAKIKELENTEFAIDGKILESRVKWHMLKYNDALTIIEDVLANDLNLLHLFKAKNQEMLCYSSMNEKNQVLLISDKLEEIFNSLSKDEKSEVFSQHLQYRNISAVSYIYMGEYQKGVKILKEILYLAEEKEDKIRIITSLINLAITNLGLGEIDLASEYNEKAMEVHNSHDNEDIPGYLERKQFIFGQAGAIQYFAGNFQLSIDHTHQALEIAQKMNFLLHIVYNNAMLILINCDSDNREKASKHIKIIEEIYNKNKENVSIKVIYQIGQAYYLKSSTRAKHKIKAQEILEEIIYQDVIQQWYTNFAIVLMLDLLLDELKQYGDEEVLNEIEQLLERLYLSYEKENDISALIYCDIFKSKLRLIQGDITDAIGLLESALVKAHQKGLKQLEVRIGDEKSRIESELHKWKELTDKGGTILEKIELADYKNYIKDMTRMIQFQRR